MIDKDITMDDIKKQIESYMEQYNNGKLSQKEVSVLLKLSEALRLTFKVEKQFNALKEKHESVESPI